MSDPEARYIIAKENVLACQREYREAESRLIKAERELRQAKLGTAYAKAVAHSNGERQ